MRQTSHSQESSNSWWTLFSAILLLAQHWMSKPCRNTSISTCRNVIVAWCMTAMLWSKLWELVNLPCLEISFLSYYDSGGVGQVSECWCYPRHISDGGGSPNCTNLVSDTLMAASMRHNTEAAFLNTAVQPTLWICNPSATCVQTVHLVSICAPADVKLEDSSLMRQIHTLCVWCVGVR